MSTLVVTNLVSIRAHHDGYLALQAFQHMCMSKQKGILVEKNTAEATIPGSGALHNEGLKTMPLNICRLGPGVVLTMPNSRLPTQYIYTSYQVTNEKQVTRATRSNNSGPLGSPWQPFSIRATFSLLPTRESRVERGTGQETLKGWPTKGWTNQGTGVQPATLLWGFAAGSHG